MEPRILAATLATLATIFAGLNGGAFTADDIRNTELADQQITQKSGLNSLMPDIPLLDKLTQRPEPKNQVRAVIQIKDASNLKLRKAKIKAENLNQIKTSRMNIDSDQDIQFQGFTGKIEFNNKTRFNGRSTGLNTSGVNLTTPTTLDTEASTRKIQVRNTNKSKLKFSKASIKPAKGSEFGINTENTNLNINSYTGDITVYTENKTLVLNGKVDTLEAGKYQLQSQN